VLKRPGGCSVKELLLALQLPALGAIHVPRRVRQAHKRVQNILAKTLVAFPELTADRTVNNVVVRVPPARLPTRAPAKAAPRTADMSLADAVRARVAHSASLGPPAPGEKPPLILTTTARLSVPFFEQFRPPRYLSFDASYDNLRESSGLIVWEMRAGVGGFIAVIPDGVHFDVFTSDAHATPHHTTPHHTHTHTAHDKKDPFSRHDTRPCACCGKYPTHLAPT
jgi:hypothetical protein